MTPQYNRRETLEINPVLSYIADDNLEPSVCQTLSLTGISVEPDDLQACHCTRKKDRVITKFKAEALCSFKPYTLILTELNFQRSYL